MRKELNLLGTTLVNFDSQFSAVISAAIQLVHCVLVRENQAFNYQERER